MFLLITACYCQTFHPVIPYTCDESVPTFVNLTLLDNRSWVCPPVNITVNITYRVSEKSRLHIYSLSNAIFDNMHDEWVNISGCGQLQGFIDSQWWWANVTSYYRGYAQLALEANLIGDLVDIKPIGVDIKCAGFNNRLVSFWVILLSVLAMLY
jgi:hypothetical protein